MARSPSEDSSRPPPKPIFKIVREFQRPLTDDENLPEHLKQPIRLPAGARMIENIGLNLVLGKIDALMEEFKLFGQAAKRLHYDVSGRYTKNLSRDLRQCEVAGQERRAVYRCLHQWASGKNPRIIYLYFSSIYHYVYLNIIICGASAYIYNYIYIY